MTEEADEDVIILTANNEEFSDLEDDNVQDDVTVPKTDVKKEIIILDDFCKNAVSNEEATLKVRTTEIQKSGNDHNPGFLVLRFKMHFKSVLIIQI